MGAGYGDDRRPEEIPSVADLARIKGELRQQAQPEGAPGADPVEQLEKLANLHASGALSDAEFAAAKAKLLGQS